MVESNFDELEEAKKDTLKVEIQCDIRCGLSTIQIRPVAFYILVNRTKQIVHSVVDGSGRINRIDHQRRAMMEIRHGDVLFELILCLHGRMLGKLWIAARSHILERLVAGQMIPRFARKRLLTRRKDPSRYNRLPQQYCRSDRSARISRMCCIDARRKPLVANA
mgnify:CR=1 FL=1